MVTPLRCSRWLSLYHKKRSPNQTVLSVLTLPEKEIATIVEQSREGQIVQSIGIGPIQTATILAAIGSIENFPNAGSLKSYCGWSPTVVQSGSTLDSAKQTRGGTRTMKQMMFLIVTGLITRDTEWARLYERLVQAKCPVDLRTGQRTGKLRVTPASSSRQCMLCSKRMPKC